MIALATKRELKPGAMLYPLPVVMVSCAHEGRRNIITVAYTGTVAGSPPTVVIGVRKDRHSYDIIRQSGEFVINIPDQSLLQATDHCGTTSGRGGDKFQGAGLTPVPASKVGAPLIAECPCNLECRVSRVVECGSHDVFFGEIVAVHAAEDVLDENGRIDMLKAKAVVYGHRRYHAIGERLDVYGFSAK